MQNTLIQKRDKLNFIENVRQFFFKKSAEGRRDSILNKYDSYLNQNSIKLDISYL